MELDVTSYSAAMSAGGEQASELFMDMHRNMVDLDQAGIGAALSAAEWNQHLEPELYALERWPC